MKKLLVIAGALLVGIVAWKLVLAQNPACQVYEAFATNAVSGAHQSALSHADGPILDARLFASRKSKAPFTPPFMGSFHGASYSYESIERAGNQVELEVIQTVSYTPPGTHSAMGGTMADQFRHRVTVEKRGSDWKVVRFESTPLGTVASR